MTIQVTLHTNRGPIHLNLHDDKTPVTVASFVNLVRRGYYDGLSFHRVINDFMVQRRFTVNAPLCRPPAPCHISHCLLRQRPIC